MRLRRTPPPTKPSELRAAVKTIGGVMDGKTARSRATSIRPRAISIHYAAPISDRMAHMTLTPTINRRMVPDEGRSSYDYQVKKVVNADVRGIARGRALSMHFSDCKRARQLGGFDKHASACCARASRTRRPRSSGDRKSVV